MKNPIWVTRELLVAIHDRQLAEHGGTPGVRDEAAIASLLDEPKRRSANSRMSVPRLAAAYTVWICSARPFNDGNARTAAAVCNTFLSLNGFEPVSPDVEFYLAVTRIAAGDMDEVEFDRWLNGQHHESPAGPTPGRSETSHRSATMTTQYECPRCGSTDAEPGSITSTGGVYFRPTNAKFLTLKTANIEVKANACTHCGHVDLVADVRKLAALTARAQPV